MTAPLTTEESTAVTENEQEQPRYAHYVDKSQIVDASVNGTALLTLCGKKLIPGRDPRKFPPCPVCLEEFENIKKFLES